MPKRENKATIRDTTMEDAFQQGFQEGMARMGMQLIYEFTGTFEGVDLQRVQFSDLDQALAEARHLLLNGEGTQITIVATAVSTPQVRAPETVAQGRVISDQETVTDEADLVE